MSDNISVTPGAGAVVKTEPALDGTAQIQCVKLEPSAENKLTRVLVNINSSGDNTLVTAVAAKVVSVYYGFLVAQGSVSLNFRDGVAGSSLNGAAFPIVANGSVNFPWSPEPWIFNSPGNALVLNLSAAVVVTGVLYVTQQ